MEVDRPVTSVSQKKKSSKKASAKSSPAKASMEKMRVQDKSGEKWSIEKRMDTLDIKTEPAQSFDQKMELEPVKEFEKEMMIEEPMSEEKMEEQKPVESNQ